LARKSFEEEQHPYKIASWGVNMSSLVIRSGRGGESEVTSDNSILTLIIGRLQYRAQRRFGYQSMTDINASSFFVLPPSSRFRVVVKFRRVGRSWCWWLIGTIISPELVSEKTEG
jgi:hypothetical protein